MQRTMFDRGFRPGATTFGAEHGRQVGGLGNSFTDAIKKYTSAIYPPAGGVPAGTVPLVPVVKAPEPTILGMPQSTAMWVGAGLLGVGVVAAIVASQKG